MSSTGSLLLAAFGLMLVIEGLLPLSAPDAWRDAFRKLIQLRDGQLRFLGLLAVAIGATSIFIALRVAQPS